MFNKNPVVVCVLPILLLFSSMLGAVDLELTQGINATLPLGIYFAAPGIKEQQLGQVVDHDLRLSGQFNIISGAAIQEKSSPAAWRQIGADSVVIGTINQLGYDRYEVSYKLVDTMAGSSVLLSKKYTAKSEELRSLAHHISDEVYQKLTGERGVFSTRIAYVFVQRTTERSQYFLDVADFDGYNPQHLLVSTEPLMSPSWSPDGRQLAYVSFEKKKAQIFIIDVVTGRRRLVTNFAGINGAPTWSKDGRQLAVVLSKTGAPKIYSVDLSSGSMRQLTFGDAIDTEPHYSPDGRFLLFTSGRGGSPQVYRLSLADGSIARVTYSGNYNAKASYLPDQKHIVMLHRDSHNFNIALQDENGQITPLTSASLDESPAAAPNGRLILYATRRNDVGVIGIVSSDGRTKAFLPTRAGDMQEPSWSPVA